MVVGLTRQLYNYIYIYIYIYIYRPIESFSRGDGQSYGQVAISNVTFSNSALEHSF